MRLSSRMVLVIGTCIILSVLPESRLVRRKSQTVSVIKFAL